MNAIPLTLKVSLFENKLALGALPHTGSSLGHLGRCSWWDLHPHSAPPRVPCVLMGTCTAGASAWLPCAARCRACGFTLFQDSGISGRKRKASTSLTDDEGVSLALGAACRGSGFVLPRPLSWLGIHLCVRPGASWGAGGSWSPRGVWL